MIAGVDLSYTFHQIKSVVQGFGKESNPNILSNAHDEGIFVRKVATQIAFELRQIARVDHLVIAMDTGKPWRELVYDKYKGNRGTPEEKEKSEFNWKRFYEIQNHMVDLLEAQGALILRKKGAEADDLLYCMSRVAAKRGLSFVIITSDRDLYQCVSANPGEGAVVQFNNNSTTRKLVFPPNFHNWIKQNDEEDIFNMSLDRSDGDILMDLYQKLENLEVNQSFHVFQKILQGDKGDNVPAIHYWDKDTSKGKNLDENGEPKKARVTDSITQKVWEKLSKNDFFDTKSPLTDDNIFSALHMNLELYTKTKIDPIVLKQRYLENRTWMELHEEIIPSEIMEYVEEEFSKIKFLTKFDNISLLKGSQWEKEIKMTLDLFKDLQPDDNDVVPLPSALPKTNSLF